jgi:hypothetical protein
MAQRLNNLEAQQINGEAYLFSIYENRFIDRLLLFWQERFCQLFTVFVFNHQVCKPFMQISFHR